MVVFPNLYGDNASDLAAGLVGGLGIAPGANIGKDYAVFEAVHGSAPDIAGQNKANPTAEIMSAAMMLDHLGELEIAERIRRGVRAVYADGSVLTGDIRKATGSSAPAASCSSLRRLSPPSRIRRNRAVGVGRRAARSGVPVGAYSHTGFELGAAAAG